MLAILRKRESRWFKPLLAGLAGCALLSIIVLPFAVLPRLPKPAPDITPNNVEANIKTWIDTFGWGQKKIDEDLAYFTIEVTLHDDTHVRVARLKKFDRYIAMQAGVSLGPEEQAKLDKLSKEEAQYFKVALHRELARARIDAWEEKGTIQFNRTLLISNNLTEPIFLQNMLDVAAASKLVRAAIISELETRTKAKH